VISQVAEVIPEKIERLVYIAAFLLKAGDSILEAMQRDKEGQFFPRLTFSEDQSYATASEKIWRNIALHDVAENLYPHRPRQNGDPNPANRDDQQLES